MSKLSKAASKHLPVWSSCTKEKKIDFIWTNFWKNNLKMKGLHLSVSKNVGCCFLFFSSKGVMVAGRSRFQSKEKTRSSCLDPLSERENRLYALIEQTETGWVHVSTKTIPTSGHPAEAFRLWATLAPSSVRKKKRRITWQPSCAL